MENTAKIRIENRNRLRRRFWQGGEHTKLSLAHDTGLSLATCSTLLNEMEADGEIIGVKRRLGEVGRSSTIYRANEETDLILCLHCDLIDRTPSQSWSVRTVTGQVLEQSLMQPQTQITAQSLADLAKAVCRRYPAIRQIMLGVPGVAEDDTVRYCDIPDLDDQPLRSLMQAETGCAVHMENDMHYRIYGYARQHADEQDVLTLCYWNRSVLPGTATFHKGTLITGHNLFAGYAAFLPYPMGRERQMELLGRQDTAQSLIDAAVCCMISLLNPNVMVLSGDLFSPQSIPHLQTACRRFIPEAYLPCFQYVRDTEPEYLIGMYQRALDLKCDRSKGGA